MENLYSNNKKNMITSDDIATVNKVDIFLEIEHHLLEDECPSNYLNDLSHRKIFQDTPFSMLKKLKETMQSPIHHPEGNVWNHTMLVVDEAARVKERSKKKDVFMWAALLHDIGKPDTTRFRKDKITAYDHDRVGALLTKKFLEYFPCKHEFIEDVVILVRWHMHILYVIKDLPFSKLAELIKEADIEEVALLGLCDRLGRYNIDRQKEEENIRLFIDKCKKFKQSNY
jgi:putative nucleotidyltransferase with HDIG domain